jgi:hypothetical protein
MNFMLFHALDAIEPTMLSPRSTSGPCDWSGGAPTPAEKEGETETALRGLIRIHLFTVIALKDLRLGRLMLLGLYNCIIYSDFRCNYTKSRHHQTLIAAPRWDQGSICAEALRTRLQLDCLPPNWQLKRAGPHIES